MNNKKLKIKLIAILLCGVWLLSPMTPISLFGNRTAQAVSPLWDGSVATSFAGGTGTEADPFLISTAAQLAYFSQRVNSGTTYEGDYIKLTQDILLNEMNAGGTFVSEEPTEFTCIGNNGSTTGNSGGFMGTFDGNGNRVIGLYINQPNLDNQGLFGFVNDNNNSYGTIKCVGVIGSVTGRENVGGVVGRTRGMVQMCYSNCIVTGVTHVGGVVGNSDQHSIVRNCYNTGPVTGVTHVGGVSGIIDKFNVELDNNYSCGTVTGDEYVGGVAGSNEHSGTIWHNYYDTDNFDGKGIGTDTGGEDVDLPAKGWDDGAVGYSSSNMQNNIPIVDLLNTNNPDGPVWILDTPNINDGYPILGVHAPLSVVSFKIAEGKHYTAATLATSTPVTVTADSVFTVGYTMRYNVSYNLAAQTVGLSNNGAAVQLPVDTSIIMLAEDSYYYINLATPSDKISLGEFIKMGSTTDPYAPAAQAQTNDVKDFLFIFDFSKTATASQIATGTYNIELLNADGDPAGTMPVVTVAGINTYSLTASGAIGPLTVNLSRVPVAGYDYKTNGKSYAYEFYLEQGEVTVPWPIGTKFNGTVITSTLPYAFAEAAFGDASVSIDMSDCAIPLDPGSYTVQVKAYACTNVTTPRDGYWLANGAATIMVATPAQYAIRASAGTRVFGNSAAAIPVVFNIETLGSGTVKATLQRKYGMVYVNITDQMNQPVTITGGSATLTIPADYEMGTYRFVLTLYDNNNTARAQAVESVIIK